MTAWIQLYVWTYLTMTPTTTDVTVPLECTMLVRKPVQTLMAASKSRVLANVQTSHTQSYHLAVMGQMSIARLVPMAQRVTVLANMDVKVSTVSKRASRQVTSRQVTS